MTAQPHLDWPFFEPHHKTLAADLDRWARSEVGAAHVTDGTDVDEICRGLVRQLGQAGWLKYAVGGTQYGACADGIDTRSICLIRETLARHSGLADFAFAMQGLGSGAITLFGTPEQKAKYLPQVVQGNAIAAFALSEADAGSDVAAMQCEARRDGDGYLLNGEKNWISNGGIAGFYIVFARTGEAEGSRGITAFIVDSTAPGFSIGERIEIIAPHPLAKASLSRTAWSRTRSDWANRAADSRSLWRPSTCFALL